MLIIHITPELAPIAKTGGLGDVTYGLCKELVQQGHTVRIFLPNYHTIDPQSLSNRHLIHQSICTYGDFKNHKTITYSARLSNLDLFLIDTDHPMNPFGRSGIYGFFDDPKRFAYFSRACLDFLSTTTLQPDVIHLHDWPTALVAPLQKIIYQIYPHTKVVLTIHNAEYQGKYDLSLLETIGVDTSLLLPVLQSHSDSNTLNLLQGGITCADHVTTVSPSYRTELVLPTYGFGLESILQKNQHKLSGILNGIDENFWNPSSDSYLPSFFPTHPEKWDLVCKGKLANKRHLQKRLGLRASDRPLFGSIGRLVDQKSPELIAHAFSYLLQKDAQCVILGSTYTPNIQDLFSSLQQQYISSSAGKILLTYDEELAHQIYAGADVIMVPSTFEPCGLTQLIAMRYGALPLVRATGGLADTVSEKNGFLFHSIDTKDLESAINQALHTWDTNHPLWKQKMQYGMSQDFSWKYAAQQYVKLYSI